MLNIKYTHIILIATLFIWIGFIGAISFMESWLKFKATGVTLKIGLSIGSLVFNALNKVEIVLAIVVISTMKFHTVTSRSRLLKLSSIPVSILLLQTFYLLPSLDERIYLIQHSLPIEKSYHHVLYILLELVKVTSLILIGIQILNRYEHT